VGKQAERDRAGSGSARQSAGPLERIRLLIYIRGTVLLIYLR
jgi:hypothetical protein